MRIRGSHGIKYVHENNLLASPKFEVWFGVAHVVNIEPVENGAYWITYRFSDGSESGVRLENWQTLTVYEVP
jgi:hypothetical protein